MEDSLVQHYSNLVTAINTVNGSQGVMSNLQEFALGGYITTPNTQKVLAFGYDILNIGTGTVINIGPGFVREGNQFSNTSTAANYTLLANLYAYSSGELAKYYPNNSSETVQGVYLMGSIYLVMSEPTIGPPATPVSAEIIITFTEPLVNIANDSIDVLNSKLLNGLTPPGTSPSLSSGQTAVELYRFLINLNSYTRTGGNDIIVGDTTIYDVRRNQCYPGFAEENMAVNLLPAIIKAKALTDVSQNNLNSQLLLAIQHWAKSYTNFQSYWTGNPLMPPALKAYILAKFGISL